MYLYKKTDNKTISIYNFIPDKFEVKKFKEKHIEDIKSVKLHISNKSVADLLFKSPTIMFDALDRHELNGRISYIEETDNDRAILYYINGMYDSIDPISVIGGVPTHLSFHSGNLENKDCTLLLRSGSYDRYNTFESSETILLAGVLDIVQPLLSNNINNLSFPQHIHNLNSEVIEFLKMFSCEKQHTISFNNLQLLEEEGLITFSDDFDNVLYKSEILLDSYTRAKRKK